MSTTNHARKPHGRKPFVLVRDMLRLKLNIMVTAAVIGVGRKYNKGVLIMNEFLTWEYLLTFGGCVAGTAIVTELLKRVSFLKRFSSQFISYVVALVILVVAQLATGTLTWQMVALDVFNAAVVSFSSNGVYDAVDTITK